jgi:hypothetical protein
MIIDCDTCTVRGVACTDCVVSFLTVGPRPGTVDLVPAEAAAIDSLVSAGLVPPLRHRSAG